MEKKVGIIGAGISGLLACKYVLKMVIGAGISGLLACKYVLKMGFTPVVFEAKPRVGGVWTQTFETTKLQNFKQSYQFLDYPWPISVQEDFPNHNQILEYVESYAHHFDLLRYINFNSKVVSIDHEGVSEEDMASWDLWGGNGHAFGSKGIWNITVENMDDMQSPKVYQVGFVILCIGKFSDLRNVPDFPPNKGPEVFKGKVLHSMDYSAMDDAMAANFIKGKRVTIIGNQKSALDLATECAVKNGAENPCTLIYMTAHWSVPNFSPWGVPFSILFFHRFAEFMYHKPGEGLFLSILATLLSPLRWMLSTFVESYIKWKLPLKKHNMVPKHSFVKDLTTCSITVNPNNFYERVEEGSIVLKHSNSFSFCKDGLMLDNNIAPHQTDIVIFATGFKGDEKLHNIFASPTYKKHMKTASLYRECIHPRIPQLAVIGYSTSLLNLFTSEIRCQWVGNLLKGDFRLPRIKEMEEDMLRWEKYMKEHSMEYKRRSFLGVLQIWYNDQLCMDIGCNPRRKDGVFKEIFQPYGPSDYIDLCPQ